MGLRTRWLVLAVVAVLMLALFTAATGQGQGLKKKPAALQYGLVFEGSGTYSGEDVGVPAYGCTPRNTENDTVKWDSIFQIGAISTTGGHPDFTARGVPSTDGSTWHSTESESGGDCDVAGGATCDSTDVDASVPDDDDLPMAFTVGSSASGLHLKVEAIRTDFYAKNTTGDPGCPTQDGLSGAELFVTLLNAHRQAAIPLAFEADVTFTKAELATGATKQVSFSDSPDCTTSTWTYCTNKIAWKGTVKLFIVKK